MADVTNEQQRPAMQRDGLTVRALILAVRVEVAGECLAVLRDFFRHRADHQAEPVTMELNLVVGIDSGNRVFAIDDRADGRSHQHFLYVCRVDLADRIVCVDFEVQAVVPQQYGGRRSGIALIAMN